MKRIILAAALAAMFTMPAQAEILFRGVYQITAVSNCPNGPSVGDRDNFHFHPRNLGGNSNWAGFTTIADYGGQEYRLSDGFDFINAFQGVRNGGLGWDIYTPEKPSSVRVSQFIPSLADLVATTPSLTIVGRIRIPAARPVPRLASPTSGLSCCAGLTDSRSAKTNTLAITAASSSWPGSGVDTVSRILPVDFGMLRGCPVFRAVAAGVLFAMLDRGLCRKLSNHLK